MAEPEEFHPRIEALMRADASGDWHDGDLSALPDDHLVRVPSGREYTGAELKAWWGGRTPGSDTSTS